MRVTPKALIARIKGVTTREAAEALTGTKLYLPRARLPASDEDEWYHADLVGLAAVDADGAPIGTVVAVHNFGAGDIVEITPASGERQYAGALQFGHGAGGRYRARPHRARAARGPRMTWRATVLTILPEMFPGPLGASLAGKALSESKWTLDVIDIRDFATDKHRSVDDTPAGGGAGMVMRADIAAAAIDAAREGAAPDTPTLYLSPRGKPLTQARVRELASGPGAILLCGRFEGIDERVLEARNIEEVSIGDYVLSGGELAAWC